MNKTYEIQDFPVKTLRFRRFFRNLAIGVVAAFLHFLLQFWLGSWIAGEPVTNIPATTKATLALLVIVFLGLQISLFLLINKFGQNLRERSFVSFLFLMPLALVTILLLRVPYSSVFLFWGGILLVLFWYITSLALQRFNRPVIGLPTNAISDFDGFIDPRFIRNISPEMRDQVKVDLIVLKERDLASPEWAGFLMQCFLRSITVEEHGNLMEKLSGRVDLAHFSFRNSLQLVRENNYLPIKRLIDIFVSACLLLALFPLLVIFAAIIRLESAGHPIFSQKRVGMGGRPFVIYKFRSMRQVDGDSKARFAAKHDERITPLGRLLRRSRIDELPQLWNVLVGDMSLIGPRPEQVDLTNSIEDEIPLFSLRHSVRPGITGWAQVLQGYADDISTTRTKLSYDLWYVSNVSMLVDIAIAMRTLKVIFTGFGSR